MYKYININIIDIIYIQLYIYYSMFLNRNQQGHKLRPSNLSLLSNPL